jgi:hypothetical protein
VGNGSGRSSSDRGLRGQALAARQGSGRAGWEGLAGERAAQRRRGMVRNANLEPVRTGPGAPISQRLSCGSRRMRSLLRSARETLSRGT